MPDNTVFCFSLCSTPESKLPTCRPMPLRVLGLGDDIMSSTAQWSWKSLAFSAFMYCAAQEYGTSSTTNDVGDHEKK